MEFDELAEKLVSTDVETLSEILRSLQEQDPRGFTILSDEIENIILAKLIQKERDLVLCKHRANQIQKSTKQYNVAQPTHKFQFQLNSSLVQDPAF